jgi:arylsulfatase A-like enzyme
MNKTLLPLALHLAVTTMSVHAATEVMLKDLFSAPYQWPAGSQGVGSKSFNKLIDGINTTFTVTSSVGNLWAGYSTGNTNGQGILGIDGGIAAIESRRAETLTVTLTPVSASAVTYTINWVQLAGAAANANSPKIGVVNAANTVTNASQALSNNGSGGGQLSAQLPLSPPLSGLDSVSFTVRQLSQSADSTEGGFLSNFSVTAAVDTPALTLAGFTYRASDGSAEVSIRGDAGTRYKLVKADDLDFSSPDQDPVPLTGVSVGLKDGNYVVTDGVGKATVQFNLGTAKDASFIRAESLGAAVKPNILFISIDDLRPELGCYGVAQIQTPHIDSLASGGTMFRNAYCNAAVCGASRASLLTGLRPIPGQRFTAWNARADQDAPGIDTLPEFLRQHGYHTVSNGKVMHVQGDSPQAWTEPAWRSDTNSGAGIHYYNIYNDWVDPASAALASNGYGPFYEAAEVADGAYQDGQLCDKTIADLTRIAKNDQPFFLACGFWRPHLPFNAPKAYWDLYDRQALTLPSNRFRPANAPAALTGSAELPSQYTAYAGYPDDDAFQRLARHGYYASVSYIDAQVGRLLTTLKALGLDTNTIVVLWGDNGYHLGEHNFWTKHNTLDCSVRVPLIIRRPGNPTGVRNQLVEFVDVYPTLCDLASIPVPAHCEGKSMVPILNNPTAAHKEAVFTSYGSAYAVKTDQFLYTEFSPGGDRMMFDHQVDPQENTNISEQTGYQQDLTRHQQLLNDLRQSWVAP